MAGRVPSWLAWCAVAAAVEIASLAVIRIAYGGAFGPEPWLGEGSCVAASYAVLVAGGLASCGFALAGAYVAVLRLRPLGAALVVVFVCAPLVLLAVTALYGALVCLAAV